MPTPQTISIIGATGSMGSAISKSLSHGPYRLILFSRDAAKVQLLVNEIMATDPVAEVTGTVCSVDACWEADIIIPAVPFAAEGEVAGRIREVANQKIVISICNPLNPDATDLVTGPDTSAAEELQKALPHSKVVKAFNTLFAASFSVPAPNGEPADVFVAGNDAEAVATVQELVRTAGFHPVLAGPLPASRTLELMQQLLIRLTQQQPAAPAGWKILYHHSH